MKEFLVRVPDEAMVRIKKGLSVQGGMTLIKKEDVLLFNPHDLARYEDGYRPEPDKLIMELEHGRLMESPKRIKFHESIPKKIGVKRILSVLDRELKEAKNALMDREIIDRV